MFAYSNMPKIESLSWECCEYRWEEFHIPSDLFYYQGFFQDHVIYYCKRRYRKPCCLCSLNCLCQGQAAMFTSFPLHSNISSIEYIPFEEPPKQLSFLSRNWEKKKRLGSWAAFEPSVCKPMLSRFVLQALDISPERRLKQETETSP